MYIQIEIGPERVIEKGQPAHNKRGLKFNNYAIEKMSEKLSGGSVTAFTYAMFWGGFVGNSYAKEQEPDYSFEDVIDWVDGLPKDKKIEVIEKVTAALTESQNYKDLIETGAEIVAQETEAEKKSELNEPILKT